MAIREHLKQFGSRLRHWISSPELVIRTPSNAILVLVMVGLVVVAAWVLVHTILEPFRLFGGKSDFATRLADIINGALLIVILVELVEAILEQVKYDERLRPLLVRNLLVIGIVSAIRHLLTAGAELSLVARAQTSERQGLVQELAINALIVILLTSVWLLTFRLTRDDEDKDRGAKAASWSQLMMGHNWVEQHPRRQKKDRDRNPS